MDRVKRSMSRRCRKLCRAKRKNVAIAIIEDIVTNVALVIVGYLLNACIRFMVGWDSREAWAKLRRLVQRILSPREE